MVTVCKYFLTNSCRYGDRCRFSHVLPNENYRSNANPYVYDARQKGEGISVMQRLSSQPSTSLKKDEIGRVMPEYLKKIAEDLNQIEQQHMWPLTCYSFLKSQGNLPGWNDVSMEEVRWEAYQAQANGTTQLYLSTMQELLSHAKELRNSFLRPSKQTEAIIRDYMKGNSSSTTSTNENVPFFMSQPSKTQSNFSFASTFEKSQPSVFGQIQSSSTSNFFNQTLESNLHINQTSPSQPNTFFGAKSSFDTPQPTGNIFQTTTAQVFTPNVEIRPDVAFNSGSLFHQTASGRNHNLTQTSNFKQNDSNFKNDVNVRLYSNPENLSKEDYEAFKALKFTLENIPIVPPPKELC